MRPLGCGDRLPPAYCTKVAASDTFPSLTTAWWIWLDHIATSRKEKRWTRKNRKSTGTADLSQPLNSGWLHFWIIIPHANTMSVHTFKCSKTRVAVDMDIHGYIHVCIADLSCTMDISTDISTSFKDMISRHLVVPLTHSSRQFACIKLFLKIPARPTHLFLQKRTITIF